MLSRAAAGAAPLVASERSRSRREASRPGPGDRTFLARLLGFCSWRCCAGRLTYLSRGRQWLAPGTQRSAHRSHAHLVTRSRTRLDHRGSGPRSPASRARPWPSASPSSSATRPCGLLAGWRSASGIEFLRRATSASRSFRSASVLDPKRPFAGVPARPSAFPRPPGAMQEQLPTQRRRPGWEHSEGQASGFSAST